MTMVGASLMTSAELRWHAEPAHFWCTVKLWPSVLSVTRIRYLWLDVLYRTDAVIESPGWILMLLGCSSRGKTSRQAKYWAFDPSQSASMPSCSTVLLVKPSRPTQSEEYVPLAPPGDTAQLRNGTKNVALMLRNLLPLLLTAYPPQFVEPTVFMLLSPRAALPAPPVAPAGSAAGIIGCGAGGAIARRAAARCAGVGWAVACEALKAAADAASVSAATAVPVIR